MIITYETVYWVFLIFCGITLAVVPLVYLLFDMIFSDK